MNRLNILITDDNANNVTSLWLVTLTREGRLAQPNPWDAWGAFVVCAASEEEARTFHPNGEDRWGAGGWGNDLVGEDWADDPRRRALVQVQRLGDAAPGVAPGVVLAG